MIGPNSDSCPDWIRNMTKLCPNISEPLWPCANDSVASACLREKMQVSNIIINYILIRCY